MTPEERLALVGHYHFAAFATAIVPLVGPSSYACDLYVQGTPHSASRCFVRFESQGDAMLHSSAMRDV